MSARPLADVRADLELGRAEGTVKDLLAVEGRLRRDAVDFRKALLTVKAGATLPF